MSREHLSTFHHIELPDPVKLFEELQKTSQAGRKTRIERMWYIQDRIKKFIRILYEFSERPKNMPLR